MAQKKNRKNPVFYSYVIYRGDDDDDEVVELKPEGPLFVKRNERVGLNKTSNDFNQYDNLEQQKPIQEPNQNQEVSIEDVIQCGIKNVDDIPDIYICDIPDDILNTPSDTNNFNENYQDINDDELPLSPSEYIDYISDISNESLNQDDYDQLVDYFPDPINNNYQDNNYNQPVNNNYQDNNYQDNNYNQNNYQNQPVNNNYQDNNYNQNNNNPNVDSNNVPYYNPQDYNPQYQENIPNQSINNNPNNGDSNSKHSFVNHVYGKYNFPPLSLLNNKQQNAEENVARARNQKELIEKVLSAANIKAKVIRYEFGPTVITYIIEFDSFGENTKRLLTFENNFKMALAVEEIRILVPIPGTSYCGIEVPYEMGKGKTVSLYELLNSDEFKYCDYSIPIVIGKTNFNENIIVDIEQFPHGLCSGTTKSGKSVCLNVILMSILYKLTPDDVRLIIIDPKVMEFNRYSDIPHLAMPVITDEQYFEPVLEWLIEELEYRNKLNTKYDCVNLKDLNKELEKEGLKKKPYILLVMDEFNGWFCDASPQMRQNLGKLLEQARAVGIHIILATQRPSNDVIEGKIKANLETKLVFKVNSIADSNVVLNSAGAEKLVGRGDMIIRTSMLPSEKRLQGCFATQDEIKEVLRYVKKYNKTDYLVTLEELLQSSTQRKMAQEGSNYQKDTSGINDSKFAEVCYYAIRNSVSSANKLQQAFNMSFNRCNDILDAMSKLGILSSGNTQGKAKDILVNELELEEILTKNHII